MSEELTATQRAIVILALAIGGFAIGVAEFATMSILPYFANDYGVSEAKAGQAISAYALGVVVGAPLIAVAASRMARRTLLVSLMTYYAVANGLSALMPTWHLFVAARFFAGLPHGAYFGVATLVAASLVPRNKRTQAMSRVMAGLMIATVAGVPLANILGAQVGWRWGFGVVFVLALTCAVSVRILAPLVPSRADASPLQELAALKIRQVWLTLGIAAIGTGGMFCVYSYLASVIIVYNGASENVVPVMLMLFGGGMVIGNFLMGWTADKSLQGSLMGALISNIVFLLAFWAVAGNLYLMAPVMFFLGMSGGLSTVLQARLMDLASDAPTLSVALNQSSFNVANALGPWMGGVALSAGAGWPSVGLVGAGLACCGFLIWLVAWIDDARHRKGMVPG